MNSQDQSPGPANNLVQIGHEMALEKIEIAMYLLATLPNDAATTQAAQIIAKQLVAAANIIKAAAQAYNLARTSTKKD